MDDIGTPCWLWSRAVGRGGYGRTYLPGLLGQMLAHRLAYEAFRGPIPEGLDIDHLCRVRACVNPWHLEPVTTRENTLRGVGFAAENARKTHCPVGHPYDKVNTWLHKGLRHCRECRRSQSRAYAARRRRKEGIAPRAPKTHCKHGHAYTVENTYVFGGKRSCRTCVARSHREYAMRRRARLAE